MKKRKNTVSNINEHRKFRLVSGNYNDLEIPVRAKTSGYSIRKTS